MDANRKALGGALEELGTGHSRELEVLAEPRGELLSDEGSAVLIEARPRGTRFEMSDAMRFERANDVITKLPRSRIIRLRLVEDDNALLEIEIAPLKARRFAIAWALAREEAVEDAALIRHVRAGHEGAVFPGIDERHRSRRTELRQKARRQRMSSEDLARVDREREEVMEGLCVVPERCLGAALRDRREHLLAVLDLEVDEGDVADERLHERETLDVSVDRVLRLHVPGIHRGEAARRVVLAELVEGDLRRIDRRDALRLSRLLLPPLLHESRRSSASKSSSRLRRRMLPRDAHLPADPGRARDGEHVRRRASVLDGEDAPRHAVDLAGGLRATSLAQVIDVFVRNGHRLSSSS